MEEINFNDILNNKILFERALNAINKNNNSKKNRTTFIRYAR